MLSLLDWKLTYHKTRWSEQVRDLIDIENIIKLPKDTLHNLRRKYEVVGK